MVTGYGRLIEKKEKKKRNSKTDGEGKQNVIFEVENRRKAPGGGLEKRDRTPEMQRVFLTVTCCQHIFASLDRWELWISF